MKPYFENEYLNRIRIGTEPFRSHYIPFLLSDEIGFNHYIVDKYSSGEVISLNGKWNFKEYSSLEELKNINLHLSDEIDVPCSVQCRGYDYFQYTNHLYPFPYNPPYVPLENPIFHYQKEVNINSFKKMFIVFEGVDSAFYLFINNKKVGYSEISHSKSEFDISEYLILGKNKIDVVVLKWCASSYLEDQDKFRFSGIFRDVYLLNRPQNFIFDYKIESINQNENWYIRFSNLSNIDLNIQIKDIVNVVKPSKTVDILIDNPILWSDDSPFLYDVLIFTEEEKILERIGLRKVEIVDGVFLINGVHKKLKGVNRHESNPYNGATVTVEETLKDLELIKSINANAIRTSHYPDIPEFYELCDVLGIYIVDEADVESHGAAGIEYSPQKWQDFANNSIYNHAVFDREVSLYERDKNRTCVIIWSLGNESNWGEMFYLGADYIHAHDSRPIHYEGIFNLVDKSDYYTNRIDICSRMYPSIEDIKKDYLADTKETRPLLICEYTHAMGNSCGDAKDYWDLINSSNRIIGAFVWEWCDHCVCENNEFKFGSDFPLKHHDGNFCCDGLVTASRELKSSAYEIQAIYKKDFKEPKLVQKPLQIESDNNKQIQLEIDDINGSIKTLGLKNNILLKPIEVNVTRSPIDNEMHDLDSINKIRTAKKTVNQQNNGGFDIKYEDFDGNLLLSIKVNFKVDNDLLIYDFSYQKNKDLLLSRIGIKFALNSDNRNVEYFGFGPHESYIDKHHSCQIDEYHFDVANNFMPYIKPQDYGNHYYVSYVKCSSMLITANEPFNFSALPYSEEQISNAKHNYDLVPDGNVYFNLDVFMEGVGSHSCGPVLDQKYQTPVSKKLTFKIKLLS